MRSLRLPFVAVTLVGVAACAPKPTPAPVPVTPPIAADPCTELYAKSLAAPSLAVDRAPSVVKYDPRPLAPPYPRGVIRRDGTTKVKVSVAVDTSGRADMKTFQVIETTHAWLANDIKAKLPKWSFSPAYDHGCKVPALWVFTATPGARATK